MEKNCIFCKIVEGEIPAYKIWEDEKHLAFLGIFPNLKGMSVVITKEHISSNVFSLENQIYRGLLKAAKKTARILCKKLHLERTAMIAEGTEIDHAHIKLYPLWGYKKGGDNKHPSSSYEPKLYDKYQGWLTSQEGPQAEDEELKEIWRKITQ